MIRLGPLFTTLFFIIILATGAFMRLDIETDIIQSMPTGDTVLGAGSEVFRNHPVHDQVAIDLSLDEYNPALLADCADRLQEELVRSGLFSQVGFSTTATQMQQLATVALQQLPVLFTADQLRDEVAPLITPDHIAARLGRLRDLLAGMEGIGQEQSFAADPLGLRDLVMARLAPLMPSEKISFYRNHLLSADGRHLLLVAEPASSGTDGTTARQIDELLRHSSAGLAHDPFLAGRQLTITPVGAYRAALDNERIIRRDVKTATILATCGIALLLLFSFPRPWIGLMALLPAFAGTAAALFCYSLLYRSISVMVLGFGGALISITVDHGISYLLFLDRPIATKGREASHEAWAIGIMAVLTSIGAFIILSFSPFPIFTQLGRFAALGILFSFLFVHLAFPLIFPTMPPAGQRTLPLQNLAGRLHNPSRLVAGLAILISGSLLFFATPQFHVNLASMNTLSSETVDTDQRFSAVWGDGSDRILVMARADSVDDIRRDGDLLLETIEQDIKSGILAGAFLPSMLFPGPQRSAQNLQAWNNFWDLQRRSDIRSALSVAARDLGFRETAFDGFLSRLEQTEAPPPAPLTPASFRLLGIRTDPSSAAVVQFVTILPGNGYDAASFFSRYSVFGPVFDGAYFAKQLAAVLFSTFITMLAIVAGGVALMIALFYLDLRLTLLTVLPVGFAYLCTMATLNALGRPFDIPALMLAVVVFGMGVDYAVFYVRAYQRYRDRSSPPFILATSTILLAAASTLIGFGSLCFAEHTLLRSIGITSSLGLGYALVGTFLILPPFLVSFFNTEAESNQPAQTSIRQSVLRRYRTIEPYPRLFARLKMRFDPLFTELDEVLAGRNTIRTILDIGCGYGVPACWCLETFAKAQVYGLDPDPEKVRVATIVTGRRGSVVCARAPELPDKFGAADLILLLDMMHYLDDDDLLATLSGCRRRLTSGGMLAARFVTVPPGRPTWSWRLEDARTRKAGIKPTYRTADQAVELVRRSGLHVTAAHRSTSNAELVWIVAERDGSDHAPPADGEAGC